MNSTKPYFLRAIREWALDNELTPQLLVDTTYEGVTVPAAYVNNDQILFNVSDQAVNGLVMGNELVAFSARFNGTPWQISLPIGAVLAIFTREDGQGIFFEPTNTVVSPGVAADTHKDPGTVVREVKTTRGQSSSTAAANSESTGLGTVDPIREGIDTVDSAPSTPDSKKNTASDDESSGDDPDDSGPASRGRPNLRLVD